MNNVKIFDRTGRILWIGIVCFLIDLQVIEGNSYNVLI